MHRKESFLKSNIQIDSTFFSIHDSEQQLNMMKCLKIDEVDTSKLPFPQGLKRINIRGSSDLFLLYFRIADVEASLSVKIPAKSAYVWISTPSGQEKYISYYMLKQAFSGVSDEAAPNVFLDWVDNVLFASVEDLATTPEPTKQLTELQVKRIADNPFLAQDNKSKSVKLNKTQCHVSDTHPAIINTHSDSSEKRVDILNTHSDSSEKRVDILNTHSDSSEKRVDMFTRTDMVHLPLPMSPSSPSSRSPTSTSFSESSIGDASESECGSDEPSEPEARYIDERKSRRRSVSAHTLKKKRSIYRESSEPKKTMLRYELLLAKKDNEIMRHQVLLKQKEIDILNLRVTILSANASWV